MTYSEIAYQYTKHDMIETYTKLPPLPETRARLLSCFMNGENANEKQALYSLAVSLAQLGLDTHDLVEESESLEPLGQQARSRQLKVLAGDYFNGRFYELLSHAEQVDAVRLVSRAICEVNRMKMSMYEKFRSLKLTAEEFMENSVSIKTELFMSLSRFIPSRHVHRFQELLRLFARCEVISEELDRSGSEDIRHGWAYWYVLQTATPEERQTILNADRTEVGMLIHKYNIRTLLSAMLQTQLGFMKSLIEQFDSEALRAEVSRMLEPIAMRITAPKVAEEI